MEQKTYRATIQTETPENLKELELRFYVMCRALGIKLVDNTTGGEVIIAEKENIDALSDMIQGKDI